MNIRTLKQETKTLRMKSSQVVILGDVHQGTEKERGLRAFFKEGGKEVFIPHKKPEIFKSGQEMSVRLWDGELRSFMKAPLKRGRT